MFIQIYFRSFPLSMGQRRRQTIAGEHSFHTYSPGAFVCGNTATHSQINVNLWHHKGTNFTHHTSTIQHSSAPNAKRFAGATRTRVFVRAPATRIIALIPLKLHLGARRFAFLVDWLGVIDILTSLLGAGAGLLAWTQIDQMVCAISNKV